MTNSLLEQYRRFVEACPESDDGYLFDAPRCRFWPEPSDLLMAPPGAQLREGPAGPVVTLPGGAELPLPGFELGQLRAVFAALPCRHSRLLIELGPRAQDFVECAFSRVLFAPEAVAALERELPALEVVRFPGSPYEIVRPYWRNMLAVRTRLGVTLEQRLAGVELGQLLLELHTLLLTGEPEPGGRSSFYLPASALGRKRPTPGQFYEEETGLERRGAELLLTRGARVSVPLLGGAHYWQLLAESVSDEGALSERRLSSGPLQLGQVVLARSEQEPQSRPWFLPPRPLEIGHFDALAARWQGACAALGRGDGPALLAELAAFHYWFVRLHPLPSGNQSLAMSFVNLALQRWRGVGIPHLLLDQLALRFELAAYRQLFARAVSAWDAPWPSPADRLRQLIRHRSELNELVSELAKAPTLLEARALLPERSHAGRLALLSLE